MTHPYAIADTRDIVTPALVVFRELLEENLDRMIAIAGSAGRLRPHCKTHKMREVTELELARGIGKHKAATFAEAEMLARSGVQDVLLAYNPVGPNIQRAVRFVEEFPDVAFSVTADHPAPLAALGDAMATAGHEVDVLLDIDTGQHRTGVEPGPRARDLYRQIVETPGVRPGGLHVYDGHQHQKSREERAAAVLAEWAKVIAFRDELLASGWPVPRIVAGGTGSFPIYAGMDDPAIELSPGTCVFHDFGYGNAFPDLQFTPAAVLLTRVVSRPTPDRVTLDLGYKAVASDPPAGQRLLFPDLPEAEQVLQNEEHLVLRTPRAAEFQPGDELIAIPRHVCPTSALHQRAYVVSGGELVGRWDVAARDRQLTI
jgi:D-serine deaminase-like pyridoxal phosphate-dependent protein